MRARTEAEHGSRGDERSPKGKGEELTFQDRLESPAPASIEFHGVSHLRLTRIMRTMMRFVTMQLMVVKRMREVVEPAGSSASCMRNRTKRQA